MTSRFDRQGRRIGGELPIRSSEELGIQAPSAKFWAEAEESLRAWEADRSSRLDEDPPSKGD